MTCSFDSPFEVTGKSRHNNNAGCLFYANGKSPSSAFWFDTRTSGVFALSMSAERNMAPACGVEK